MNAQDLTNLPALADQAAAPIVVQSAPDNFSAAEVFALAGQARSQGDFVTAETAYRALTQDLDLEIRTEARFRLGLMLADDLGRYSDAALEFRRILDDKPDAARVRLELARMQAMLGNFPAARRELRAAQAAGLPPAVEQLVRFYSRALNAGKPLGGSLEVALAPDSNINRATRSDKRRVEDRYSASLAATLRALRLGSFAPLVRLKWERNRSSIEIYDYRRVAAEFGVTSAF